MKIFCIRVFVCEEHESDYFFIKMNAKISFYSNFVVFNAYFMHEFLSSSNNDPYRGTFFGIHSYLKLENFFVENEFLDRDLVE
jgi:hypothetical protein